MLPLEVAAAVCGCIGVCVYFVRRKLTSNSQKHSNIKAIADSKINSIKDLISKALRDVQISDDELKMVLYELEKYNDLKDKTHTKQSGLREAEKIKKLREEGKALASSAIQKKKSRKRWCSLMLFNKFVFKHKPPPVYHDITNTDSPLPITGRCRNISTA